MNNEQLRQALTDLQLPQSSFARLLGVTTRAVSLWLTGERAVPKPVVSYLRLFSSLPTSLKQIELAKIRSEDSGMREGMYGIDFRSGEGSGQGVLVFENGQVYGADNASVRYHGTYTYDVATDTAGVALKITFPANIRSVFGIANPYEWSIDVSAEFSPSTNSGQIPIVTSLGAKIVAQYAFLRPLPMAA